MHSRNTMYKALGFKYKEILRDFIRKTYDELHMPNPKNKKVKSFKSLLNILNKNS
ncbi:hypothetical protein KQI86_05405 [Clostridium sp. MSJ-11]|uniref:Uncharacterized protein n=1 Tax=Clostridium mobile TaxID=2841512 RepID=A0ABS6EH81_9CLOT|nr:hypothetical protein [Clostridium mobile]MBU5483759.1 hypothetical protein [Clostridium mobile]